MFPHMAHLGEILPLTVWEKPHLKQWVGSGSGTEENSHFTGHTYMSHVWRSQKLQHRIYKWAENILNALICFLFSIWYVIHFSIEMQCKVKFYKIIWKRRIIFLMQSSILRRIWLHFMALISFRFCVSSAQSSQYFRVQYFSAWASLRTHNMSICLLDAS
jgi:hypothetical protein